MAEEKRHKAMVIIAHPDDADFLYGGTVAKLCAEGCEVVYVVATSGDKGTSDPDMDGARLASIREAEQRAAAAVLGVRECVFLRHPDGFVEDGEPLRGEIVHLIRAQQPDTVITWDAYRRGFNHNDHRAVGVAAYDAVFPAARDRLYHPGDAENGLTPHKVRELLLAGSEQPDYFIDISDYFDIKLDAIYCHTSQIQPLEKEEFRRRRREQTLEAGQRAGTPFAESFRRVLLRV
ncbi:MAG TPA: PIG-L deacetylase family protein [Dehalococcoidia bacterium]|nr:PIG-L deacetylase family protein [Dehalococcoidia bacterium]